jgi:hypothetical protein
LAGRSVAHQHRGDEDLADPGEPVGCLRLGGEDVEGDLFGQPETLAAEFGGKTEPGVAAVPQDAVPFVAEGVRLSVGQGAAGVLPFLRNAGGEPHLGPGSEFLEAGIAVILHDTVPFCGGTSPTTPSACHYFIQTFGKQQPTRAEGSHFPNNRSLDRMIA